MRYLLSGLLIIVIAVITLMAFTGLASGTVVGSINPSNGGLRVSLFSSTDTVLTTANQGKFMFSNVKPGNYLLLVEGQPPYRNAAKDGIHVVDGEQTDVGVIEMQQ